jgi:hypothetical protein
MLQILLILLLAATSYADPAPSGSSGIVSHGQTVTITGSGFGTKATAAPQLWDAVENISSYSALTDGQTITVGGSNPWDAQCAGSWCAAEDTCIKMETSAGDQRGVSTKQYKSTSDVCGRLEGHTITAGTKIYASYWMKLDGDANNGGANDNNKFMRLSGTTDADTYSYNSNHDYVYRDSGGYCTVGDPSRWFEYAFLANQWNFIEVWIDSSARTWGAAMNGVSVTTDGSWANCTSFNFSRVWMIGYDAVGGPRVAQIDDIYVDNTLARVAICSGSTWAARGHCEVQPPSSWSDASLAVTINQGSFGATDSAYLYVADSTGAINSSGYSITFGGSGEPVHNSFRAGTASTLPGSGSFVER